ncbi:sigma-70 family RNA polymerase sigma factor [Actinomadura parmotrematis]|uniref:Sigma-70 family RNA polymerase sigma factor n=1 Tax=Actinomadura parmotrematis TaxID=2864039 RepID=A0ABS7FNA3_9ACTN|nr:sigma-70 family RNA polymerase sigma factor [Actinomadura parmotrematis]MBW8481867.1 sigma-70 family RNA polymerase sigma factor [Actinomadura parmotrematis]
MTRWSACGPAADRALVHGLHGGGEQALGELYDAYAERLYDYVLSLSGDDRVTADVVHDTFVDAARRAPRMRDHLNLRPWLYAAARRRVLRRGRPRELSWDAAATGECEAGLDALRAALSALSAPDQELLLLTERHGLTGGELAALLGLSPRAAASDVAKARARLRAAIAELPITAPDGGPAGDEHEDDTERLPLTVAVQAARRPLAPPRLLARRPRRPAPGTDPAEVLPLADVPNPILPAALRHRVVHTATDPELAGYRADIVARGGGLTPAGMPTQPDVPSPFTRRWLFAAGGTVGALATALAVAQLMGLGPAPTTLVWPGRPDRGPIEASPTAGGAAPPGARPSGRAPVPGGGEGGRSGAPATGPDARTATVPPPARTPGAAPTTPAEDKPQLLLSGRLVVAPAKVSMYGTKTARVTMSAQGGPVRWNAIVNDAQLTVSPADGELPADGTGELTVEFHGTLLNLPGSAVLTVMDGAGNQTEIPVEWGASLL